MRHAVGLSSLFLLAIAVHCIAGCGSTECTTESLTATGLFNAGTTGFEFTSAHANIIHRRDIDEWEDGLIASLQLELSRGTGCTFQLEAAGCVDAEDRLAIKSASLKVDSQCPGFPQEAEGLYVYMEAAALGSVKLGHPKIAGTDVAKACYASTLEISLEGLLTRAEGDLTLAVASTHIVVSGDFVSFGDADASTSCKTYFSGDTSQVDVDTAGDVRESLEEANTGPTPSVTVAVACPDCDKLAHVRFYGSPGWTMGSPEYIHVFHNPTFPIQETLDWALNSEGKQVAWPSGSVTFQAFQDTTPGGNLPEESEPVSQLQTVDLVAGHLNKVELLLEVGIDPTVSCEPGEDVCLSTSMSGHCNDGGDGYDKSDCVQSETACSEETGECEPLACVPSSISCAGSGAHHQCLPSGTGFGEETPCQGGYICLNGSCMSEECLGEIMLLVDTSGSMFMHWDAVGTSIQNLASLSPMASFGLWNFPAPLSICDVPGQPQLGMAPNQASDLSDWFVEHEAFGQTPLVEVMKVMKSQLPNFFAGSGGALVLLSDGADTCAFPDVPPDERETLIVDELTSITAALFAEHNIKTFVVGYQYKGNPNQLVAIAANGGTGKASYTEAGDENELTNALVGIVEDLKLCFE